MTSRASQIAMILSAAGFVFFVLQSLIVLLAIPVLSDNSAGVKFLSRRSAYILSLIVTVVPPFLSAYAYLL